MTEITNYNCHVECADICMEKTCSNIATDYHTVKIAGKDFLIPVCEKHSDLIWREKLNNE